MKAQNRFWRILRQRRPRQRNRVGHAAEVVAHQRDVGRFHRHVGTGAHGEGDVGGGQRRRVVDAVAGHGDKPRFSIFAGLQFRDCRRLVARQHLGLETIDSGLAGDGGGRGGVVAGEHDDLDAELPAVAPPPPSNFRAADRRCRAGRWPRRRARRRRCSAPPARPVAPAAARCPARP